MVGFKLTCLKCGNEAELVIKKVFLETDNETLSVYVHGYDHQMDISCDKCDNKLEETY